MLLDSEITSYVQNGYVALAHVFTDEEVRRLCDVTDRFVEQSRDESQSGDVFDLEPGHTSDRPMVRRLKDPEKHDAIYDYVMRYPSLLDRLCQLVGPNVRFLSSKLNLKMRGDRTPVEWHQDWAYGPYTNDSVLTVGITIDEMTVANGCLMVIPGSHRGPVLDHWEDGTFVGAVTEPNFDWRNTAVPIELPPGGVSIHHVRTLHASAPNLSDGPRRLLLFTYGAADAWPLIGIPDMAAYDARIVRGRPVAAPRLERVPVAPWPRWDEFELGAKTSLFDFQSMMHRPQFDAAHREQAQAGLHGSS